MDELLKALPSLLGVLVGGLITFFIQNRIIQKQHEWEREKIRIDKLHKDQEKLFQAYNKILHLQGVHRITHYNHWNGQYTLDTDKYFEHIRPIVFEVFHLLNPEIAKAVNQIENIFERQTDLEEAEEQDDETLGGLFQYMMMEIRSHFNKLRKEEFENAAKEDIKKIGTR